MDFLQTPFIPEGKVKLVIVDYRISPAIEKGLENEGIECIKTERCCELYEAVDGHPDMLMLHMGGNRIILAPNVYEGMAYKLIKKGFAVTKGATWLVRNYPGNIAYNVLRIGGYAFHNTKFTDVKVLEELEKDKVVLVHIKQGYTKCSVCVLDSRTAITSDLKFAETAEKYGIECFLTKPGGIELAGLNYGFIGGASGLLAKKQIAFTGSLKSLENNGKLIEFIERKGFEIKILNEGMIIDYGSVIPLKIETFTAPVYQ